jgi:hypothetical protein
VASRRILNLLSADTVELPAALFEFEFLDGQTLSSSAMTCRVLRQAPESVALLFEGAGLEARLTCTLPAGKPYLRQQLELRRPAGQPLRLVRVDLENWRGVRSEWRSSTVDPTPCGSHPIHCATWWAGVEFIAAFNSYSAEGFTLRSRPGGIPIDANWRRLRSVVVGAAGPAGPRAAFLDYIEDVRLAPARLVTCYNSWWTLPKVVRQQDNLALARELRAGLFEAHGVFFDIFTTDMGWSHPRSVWQIDRSVLPLGFDDIRPIVESAGGRLGLWMSPSELYPPVCDYDWFEKNGYAVVRHDPKRPGVSLSDPRYREETKQQLGRLIREAGLAHIKYDGFIAREQTPHHDLLPGDDSVEPLAEASLELLAASKAAKPDLVTEPTYNNSFLNYISPWILKYSDTVWANAGGDYPLGITAAPEFREAQTTAREYYIFSAMDEVWLPQNAVQHFDIVHVDYPEGFANHAAMAFGRGRFFVPVYLNPKFMAPDDWRVLAGLIRWARANRELLRHTVVLRSRVELGEPYAYAHWQGSRGVIAVRNPSNEERDYTLDLAAAGAPASLVSAVCYTQYPYRRGIAEGLRGSSRIRLRLAPWELIFLEIVPRDALLEAVALNARWFRTGAGRMEAAPDPGASQVRVLLPRRGERTAMVPAPSAAPHRLEGEVISCTTRPLPADQWLTARDRVAADFPFHYPAAPDSPEMREVREKNEREATKRKVATVAFETECRVSVPPGLATAEVLLLVQLPGRTYRPSTCIARLDGVPLPLRQADSSQHTGYFVAKADNYWKAALPYDMEWCWYIARVPVGAHRLRFEVAVAHPRAKIGLWLRSEAGLAPPISIDVACAEPAMPQHRPAVVRGGSCLRAPA